MNIYKHKKCQFDLIYAVQWMGNDLKDIDIFFNSIKKCLIGEHPIIRSYIVEKNKYIPILSINGSFLDVSVGTYVIIDKGNIKLINKDEFEDTYEAYNFYEEFILYWSKKTNLFLDASLDELEQTNLKRKIDSHQKALEMLENYKYNNNNI